MSLMSIVSGYVDWDIIIRTSVALVLSALVGFEREKAGHPAGLRTHVLVCISAAFLMAAFHNLFLGDAIARMGAAIVTGIGFLGAGAIIVYGKEVHGLTTAASIWAIAGLGVLVGIGFYVESVFVTLIFLAILRFKPLELKAVKKKR